MPDAFDDIVGQDEVVGRLRASLANNRLAHGLIFAGPVGVGKFTTAQALAGTFLGGDAETYRRVTAQVHPDFHVVTRQLIRHHDATGKSKALDLSVKVVRPELIEPANRASIEGEGKVFVIEEAETMTIAAQNAILKTLEEPHGRTLIILVTSAAESLLPTIRSRCQTFRFRELTDDEALSVMTRHDISADDAKRALVVAAGSPGRALRFLQDGVIDRADELADRLAAGEPLATFLKESADAQAAADLERDPLGSKDAFTRAGHTLYLGLIADLLRRRLRDDPDDAEALCQQIDAVARAERYLDANVNVGLVLQQFDLALS